MSAKMKISLVPSTETSLRVAGASPPGTFPWFFTSLQRLNFEPIKESSLKYLTFKTVFFLALGSVKQSGEIHAGLNKNMRQRHQSDWSKVSFYPPPPPVFFPRTSWPKRSQLLFQLWPQLWLDRLRLIGPYVQSEPCTIIG